MDGNSILRVRVVDPSRPWKPGVLRATPLGVTVRLQGETTTVAWENLYQIDVVPVAGVWGLRFALSITSDDGATHRFMLPKALVAIYPPDRVVDTAHQLRMLRQQHGRTQQRLRAITTSSERYGTGSPSWE